MVVVCNNLFPLGAPIIFVRICVILIDITYIDDHAMI